MQDPNTKYITLFENIIQDENMLREMACNPESCQLVFNELEVLTEGCIPLRDFLNLTTAISKSISINSEVARHFSDMDILKLYGNHFEKMK